MTKLLVEYDGSKLDVHAANAVRHQVAALRALGMLGWVSVEVYEPPKVVTPTGRRRRRDAKDPDAPLTAAARDKQFLILAASLGRRTFKVAELVGESFNGPGVRGYLHRAKKMGFARSEDNDVATKNKRWLLTNAGFDAAVRFAADA